MPEILKQKKAINTIVLLEVLNKIHKDYYRNARENVINFLLSIDKIYPIEYNDYIRSIQLMKHYKYSINYSDCLILLTMIHNNINKIISFDNYFDKVNNIKRIYI